MLKLTKDLYNYDPDNAEYMDYYERTLINQIAASQSHVTTDWMHNGTTYMLPIDPARRETMIMTTADLPAATAPAWRTM